MEQRINRGAIGLAALLLLATATSALSARARPPRRVEPNQSPAAVSAGCLLQLSQNSSTASEADDALRRCIEEASLRDLQLLRGTAARTLAQISPERYWDAVLANFATWEIEASAAVAQDPVGAMYWPMAALNDNLVDALVTLGSDATTFDDEATTALLRRAAVLELGRARAGAVSAQVVALAGAGATDADIERNPTGSIALALEQLAEVAPTGIDLRSVEVLRVQTLILAATAAMQAAQSPRTGAAASFAEARGQTRETLHRQSVALWLRAERAAQRLSDPSLRVQAATGLLVAVTSFYAPGASGSAPQESSRRVAAAELKAAREEGERVLETLGWNDAVSTNEAAAKSQARLIERLSTAVAFEAYHLAEQPAAKAEVGETLQRLLTRPAPGLPEWWDASCLWLKKSYSHQASLIEIHGLPWPKERFADEWRRQIEDGLRKQTLPLGLDWGKGRVLNTLAHLRPLAPQGGAWTSDQVQRLDALEAEVTKVAAASRTSGRRALAPQSMPAADVASASRAERLASLATWLERLASGRVPPDVLYGWVDELARPAVVGTLARVLDSASPIDARGPLPAARLDPVQPVVVAFAKLAGQVLPELAQRVPAWWASLSQDGGPSAADGFVGNLELTLDGTCQRL